MKKLFNCMVYQKIDGTRKTSFVSLARFKGFTIALLCMLCFFTISCSDGGGSSGGSSGSAKFDSQLESEVLRELNLARTQPATYAGFLREYATHINGNYYEVPGQPKIILQEGLSAVTEAITALESQSPLTALTLSRGLSLAAKDHVKDTGPKGVTGHTGTDGSSMTDRINRYGNWSGNTAENIQYGKKNARGIVMQLIIDDGVSSRGHRNNIYNAELKFVGISCGTHKTFGSMCVQDFAKGFTEKN